MLAALSQPATAYGYTTWKHGNLPVYREQDKWVVHYPDGNSKEYVSGRALMRGLHNGRDPHLPVDRYFKKKKTAEKIGSWMRNQPTTLDIFEIKADLEIKKRAATAAPEAAPAEAETPAPLLGIDLKNRSHEVRKLLFAGFGKKIVSMGYDPDDVLQEVYKGLLARNKGKCPWDIRKSSFGHYVHMVCGCIVSNYHRKYNRINMNERTGVRSIDDGSFIEIDVAASDYASVRGDQGDDLEETDLVQEVLDLLSSQEADTLIDKKYSRKAVSLKIVPMLISGWKRREIASELGIREGIITRCINYIRKVCRDLFLR